MVRKIIENTLVVLKRGFSHASQYIGRIETSKFTYHVSHKQFPNNAEMRLIVFFSCFNQPIIAIIPNAKFHFCFFRISNFQQQIQIYMKS